MSCDQFSENLFALREGMLSAGNIQSLEDHMSTCASCRKLNAAFDDMTCIINAERATEPNPFTATRILSRIEEEFDRPGYGNIPLWFRALQPVAIAIALITGILIGTYTAKPGNAAIEQQANKMKHLQYLKSDLFISEITDEDKILVLNK